MNPRRLLRRALVAVLAAVLLAGGCAKVPTTGTVRSGGGAGDQVGDSQFAVPAHPPRPGAGARAIVNDFLDAMASGSSAELARLYLTPKAAAAWRPDEKATIFDRSDRGSIQDNPVLSGGVSLRLDTPELATLDDRGVWQSAVPGKRLTFEFQLVRVSGELRISEPPDGRLIAQDLFIYGYEARNLYFFTPKMDAVVPDPVYVPKHTGDGQSATMLTQALLAGPTGRLGDAVLTVAPKGTEVVSVIVDADGVATVALNDRPAGLVPDLRFKLAAQLAWTLRQVPGVLKLKVTAGGQPFEVEGTTAELPMTRWDSYDGAFASQTGRQLYLLNGSETDRMNNIDAATQQQPTPAKLDGLQVYDKESIAVDLDGALMAAVTGGAVVVGPVATPATGQRDPVKVPTDGKVLRPSFDKDHNLWIVDRADTGQPRIRVRRDNGRVLAVDPRGLAGQRLSSLRVARDGVRVLVVARSSRDPKQPWRLLVGRIGGAGSPTISALEPLQLGCAGIADAGWSWPSKLIVLCRAGGASGYQLLEVNVDGSKPAPIPGNGVQDFSPAQLASAPDADALLTVRNANGEVLVRQRDLTWTKLPRCTEDLVVPCTGHPVYPG